MCIILSSQCFHNKLSWPPVEPMGVVVACNKRDVSLSSRHYLYPVCVWESPLFLKSLKRPHSWWKIVLPKRCHCCSSSKKPFQAQEKISFLPSSVVNGDCLATYFLFFCNEFYLRYICYCTANKSLCNFANSVHSSPYLKLMHHCIKQI